MGRNDHARQPPHVLCPARRRHRHPAPGVRAEQGQLRLLFRRRWAIDPLRVDYGAATLAKRAAITLPGGIQYAWPHPSRRYLYVATSSGGLGIAPVPGYPPDQHYLVAFHVS